MDQARHPPSDIAMVGGLRVESLVLGGSMAERLSLSVGDRVTFILPEENRAAYQPLSLQLSALLLCCSPPPWKPDGTSRWTRARGHA